MTDWCTTWTWGTTSKDDVKENGTYYWNVVAYDTNGNSWEVSDTWKYTIISNNPQCHIEPISWCTSWEVILRLVSDKTWSIITSGWINWRPTGLRKEWTWGVSENITITWIIIVDTDGKTWECASFTVTWYDATAPVITSAPDVDVPECTTWSFVVQASDDWCAWVNISYYFWRAFGNMHWHNNMTHNIDWTPSNEVIIPWTGQIQQWWMDVKQEYKVKDSIWNETQLLSWTIHFIDEVVTLRVNTGGVDLWLLTWDYSDRTSVHDLFMPWEWDNCQDNDITAYGWRCYLSGIAESDISMGIHTDWYGISINSFINNHPDRYGTWYCEVIFEDNERNQAKWLINFRIDNRPCLDGRWDNDHFLTPNFWNLDPTDSQVVCALYGSGWNDQTAYTMWWDHYQAWTTCGRLTDMRVVRTDRWPGTLNQNTVYVLTSTWISVGSDIILPKCTAIVSSQVDGKDTVIMDIEWVIIGEQYGILDNLSLVWQWAWAWVGMHKATYNTLNVVKIYGWEQWVDLDGAWNNVLNNLQVYNNKIWIWLNNGSIHNAINNSQVYYNEKEWIDFDDSYENIVSNTEIYGHNVWLSFANWSVKNIVRDIIYYNSHPSNDQPIMNVDVWLENYYEWDNIFIRDTYTWTATSACENAWYSVATWASTWYAIYKHEDPLKEYSYRSTISTWWCILSWEEVLICNSTMTNCHTPQWNETNTCNVSWQWTYCNTTWTQEARELLINNGWNIVTEITAERIWWTPWTINEWHYAHYAADYQTNPRSDRWYLFSWSSPTSNTSNAWFTNNVDGYSYWVNVKTQKVAQVYNGWTLVNGWKVSDNYYIWSNVERIEWKIQSTVESKTHYFLTWELAQTTIENWITVKKYTRLWNIPQQVDAAVDLDVHDRRNRQYMPFNNNWIETDLQLNNEWVEWRFEDRVSAEYWFVMQMYGEEYFATHMYRNIYIPQPYLDIEPKEFCVNLNATNWKLGMTWRWLAYEAYMTWFDTRQIIPSWWVEAIVDFQDLSDTWTQDWRIERYLYTWIAILKPDTTWSVSVPWEITQDALDILNLPTSQSYYRDTKWPEINMADWILNQSW